MLTLERTKIGSPMSSTERTMTSFVCWLKLSIMMMRELTFYRQSINVNFSLWHKEMSIAVTTWYITPCFQESFNSSTRRSTCLKTKSTQRMIKVTPHYTSHASLAILKSSKYYSLSRILCHLLFLVDQPSRVLVKELKCAQLTKRVFFQYTWRLQGPDTS